MVLTRFGGDLLSQGLSPSTIGATALNFRVRDGTGCFARAMTTKPRKDHRCFDLQSSVYDQRVVQVFLLFGYGCLLLDQIKPIGRLVPVN